MAQTADHSETRDKPVTLRDGGFGCLLWFVFPIIVVLGLAVDFIWNWLSLQISVFLIPDTDDDLGARGTWYALAITVVGALVDWPYFNLTWKVAGNGFTPLHTFPVQAVLLLFPIVLLAAANFSLGILMMRFSEKKSLALGVIMGVLTAPWLVLFVPYLMHWGKR